MVTDGRLVVARDGEVHEVGIVRCAVAVLAPLCGLCPGRVRTQVFRTSYLEVGVRGKSVTHPSVMAEQGPRHDKDEVVDGACCVALTESHLDVKSIMDRVRSPQAGAIVVFAGIFYRARLLPTPLLLSHVVLDEAGADSRYQAQQETTLPERRSRNSNTRLTTSWHCEP